MVYESNTREICSDQKSNELSSGQPDSYYSGHSGLHCVLVKNPSPLLPYLDEIGRDYPFYFQFTLNPYDQDLEPNLPAREVRIDTFRRISENYGKERVIWRYDPIILSQKYDLSWHMDQFERLADRLSQYTDTCIFSFVDIYDKIKSNLAAAKYMSITPVQEENFARCFSMIASNRQIKLKTCAEDIELEQFGIEHSCCIDSDLIERIMGYKLSVKKIIRKEVNATVPKALMSVNIIHVSTCVNIAMRITV